LLAFDPAGIGDFITSCEEIGFPVWKWEGPDSAEGYGLKLVSHAQGKRIVFEDRQLCMPRSIERLEDAVLAGNITIDASPVTYACAANALVDSDGQGNRCFDKKRSRGRIDGLVTIAMAVGAATVTHEESESVFDVIAREEAARERARVSQLATPVGAQSRERAKDGEIPHPCGSSDRDNTDDTDDRIDEAILANPRHPRWHEMKERWEREFLSADDAEF
jgi:hypothetical protein